MRVNFNLLDSLVEFIPKVNDRFKLGCPFFLLECDLLLTLFVQSFQEFNKILHLRSLNGFINIERETEKHGRVDFLEIFDYTL